MQLPRVLLLCALLAVAGRAAALEAFVVKDIRIEGIQRTEAGSATGT